MELFLRVARQFPIDYVDDLSDLSLHDQNFHAPPAIFNHAERFFFILVCPKELLWR